MLQRDIELSTGLRYALREWGQPQPGKTTVVLVHGFLDSSATWLAVVREGLADAGLHLVAPDMRGHGDSDRVGAGGYYHFADYLADLDALIETLVGPDERVALVGHSMGGSICAYFAGAFPERITKLALLEGMGPPEPKGPHPARIVKWLADWRRLRDKSQKQYATINEAADQMRKHDPLMNEELALELAELGTRKNTAGMFEFKHDPVHASQGPYPFRVDVAAEFWRAIRCPVLAVEGGKSPFRFMAEESARRYENFAELRREVLAESAHMMTRHQPRELAVMLASFLAQSPAPPPTKADALIDG